MTEPQSPLAAPDDPMIGRVVKQRYRLERALGRGGFGVAYLAIDEDEAFARATSGPRRVVVKLPLPERVAASNGAIPKDFSREASRLTGLQHAHIVKVIDLGFDGATPFLVLEYATGGSLADRLDAAAGGVQSPEEVLSWLPDVAKALDYVAGKDVLHRDVKPSNILFDEGGSALLADFGIAKVFGGTSETTGSLPGSPLYMAPDAMLLDEAKGLDGRYDQYALAVTVYEALSGRFPYEPKTWGDGVRGSMGEQAAHALLYRKTRDAPTPIVAFAGHLGERTWAPIARALSRDRDERYPSCVAFASTLRDAVHGAVPPIAPPPRPPRPSRPTTPASTRVTLPVRPVRPVRKAPPARGRFYVALAVLAVVGVGAAVLKTSLSGSKASDGRSESVGPVPSSVTTDAFLKDFAVAVGTEFDALTGYPTKIRRRKDDGEMVLVPAGTFEMGAVPGDSHASNDEKPRHEVTLSKAYYLDVNEVTNAQFQTFVAATSHRTTAEEHGDGFAVTADGSGWDVTKGVTWRAPLAGGGRPSNWERHPVVLVSHDDATAFARWAGAALPTEAQFERAVRGGDEGRTYPWGDSLPVPSGFGNYAGAEVKRVIPTWTYSTIDGYEDGFAQTAPVRSFRPNGFGAYDLSGNVREWCSDWYDGSYYAASPGGEPSGPESGSARAIRGGSWFSNGVVLVLRTSYRINGGPTVSDDGLGFRLARSL